MEKRTLEQVKVYKLLLNPITANYEKINIVALSYNENDLLKWYKSLKVDLYEDGVWRKSFKKGSVLEFYNPIDYSDYCGVESEWTTEQAIRQYYIDAKCSYGFITTPELVEMELID